MTAKTGFGAALARARERVARASSGKRPRPPIELSTGRTFPVLAGRIIAASAAVVAALVLGAPGPMAVLGLMALLLVVRPAPIWGPIAALAIGVGLLVDAAHPLRVAIALLLAHLIVTLGTLLGSVPADGRVELRALRGPGIRFAVVQIGAQALAIGAFLLAATGSVVPVLATIATIPLAVGVWRLTLRLRRLY